MDKVEQHIAKMSEPGNRESRCLTLLSTAKVGAGTVHTAPTRFTLSLFNLCLPVSLCLAH